MSEGNGSKGCIIAVVWLVILAVLAGAVWFFYTKPKSEQLNQATGSSSQYTPVSYTHLPLPTICSV